MKKSTEYNAERLMSLEDKEKLLEQLMSSYIAHTNDPSPVEFLEDIKRIMDDAESYGFICVNKNYKEICSKTCECKNSVVTLTSNQLAQ